MALTQHKVFSGKSSCWFLHGFSRIEDTLLDQSTIPYSKSYVIKCISLLQGSGETEQNELYTFHEAVTQLQDAEEQLVECHKKSVEVS